MKLEAGVLSNPYPIRKSASGSPKSTHSIRYSASSVRKLKKQFAGFKRALSEDSSKIIVRSGRMSSRHSSLPMIAREFARFAQVLSELTGKKVTNLHIESAYALLHRQVEAVPRRTDRVVVGGLACAALACTGMRVHLLVDSDLALPLLKQSLLPVYEKLGYGAMLIEGGADEASRTLAYQQSITILSARECAMDFLRDAVKWPQRSNLSMSKIDKMTGTRAKSQANLMRGLPCAVFLDIDSALIDNARAPLALTQDAHPMHEVEELKQALEMVGHLERGRHFVFIEQGAEVALTSEGKHQLDAWAKSLGGGWGVPHVAEIMLAVAIVATQLVHVEKHYRIHKNRVEWLLEDRLVPGMQFYSMPFLERLVEIKEQCEVSSQRELAARASYQQIFNRYVHLCGTCHSIQMIEKELDTIYGLSASNRWPTKKSIAFNELHYFDHNDAKIEHLRTWLANADEQSACLVLATDNDILAALAEALADRLPDLISPGEGSDIEKDLSKRLNSGAIVLGLSMVVEHQASIMRQALSNSVKIAVIGRSPRRSEDLRNQFWIQNSVFHGCERALFLCAEDELFTDASTYGLNSIVRFFGARLAGHFLERRIRRIQTRRAREFFNVRQGLLSHDSTMHSMLSFSGRGLYE